MIHHFRPAVTSVMAVALTPANRPDIEGLLDRYKDQFDHTLNPDCSVTVRNNNAPAMIYGARSDPATWWMMVDSSGSLWFTTQDPYTDETLVSTERAT